MTASTVFASGGANTAQAAGPCSRYIEQAYWTYDASPGYLYYEDLFVEPTRCGRGAGRFDTRDAFSELVKKVGMLNDRSMYEQYVCHTIFAFEKPAYDLEPWRPYVGPVAEDSFECNPPPPGIVWAVGVGNGISASTGNAIRVQLARDGPPALGQPFGGVTSHGSTCFQLFSGGWRGRRGGAGDVSAIVANNCTGAGRASWIGDYFMGYYEKYNPIANALSVVGYPTTDSTRSGHGWEQQFTGGSRGPNILMRADTQAEAHDVYGSIMARYLALGGPRGRLGLPTTDQYQCSGGNVCQRFKGGSLAVAAPSPPPPPSSSPPPPSSSPSPPPSPSPSPSPAPSPPSPSPTPPSPPSPPPYYVHHVYGTCADGGCGLHERTGPGYSSYLSVGMSYDGQEVDVVCQTSGELVTPNHGTASSVWDRLTNGTYVTDVYVDTPGVGGSFSPPIPHC